MNGTFSFSGKHRRHLLEQMAGSTEPLDLLVVGGGITGAGIALDAVARGMRVGLVEMQDFAAGTSSRSTKLVHGGLRYLKQLEIGVVAEVGRERAIVYENGPHVTTPEWMLLPIYRGGTFGRFSTSLGLRVYDFLAGVKRGERRSMLSAAETLAKEPLLKQDGLLGGGYYVEYRTDDARLTLEVLKEAAARGAMAVNYAKVTGFRYEGAQLVGAEVTDLAEGRTYELRARKIVNATGPWVDRIRALNGQKGGKSLMLTKGVHLVFDQSRFPLRQAIYFDAPDGRMIFAIPRDGKTYIGTTDTFYEGDPQYPKVTEDDRKYLLSAVNSVFPSLRLTGEDIESSWAGLRPLIAEEGKSPSEISRKDEIWQDETGLISIAGGKLTGYRKMAQSIVDLAVRQLTAEGAGPFGPCVTKHLPVSGGDVGGSKGYESYVQSVYKKGVEAGLSEQAALAIARRYGSNAEKVYACAAREKTNGEKAGLPLELAAVLMYAIEEEMAAKPVDFWVRRTGALLFDRKAVERWKQPVLERMASVYQWEPAQAAAFERELEQALDEAVNPAR